MFPRFSFRGRNATVSQVILALLGVGALVIGLVQGDGGWLLIGTVAIIVAAINFATRRMMDRVDNPSRHGTSDRE